MTDYKLRIIVDGVDNASGPLGKVSGSLGQMATIAGGIGLAQLGGALAGVAGQALNSYASFERLSASLNTLVAREAMHTGSANSMQQAMAMSGGRAQELLGWIQKLAIESPFKSEDVSAAFRLSLAMGFTTGEAQRLTKAMIDFSAGTGASGDTMERVARALGQIQSKGKLSAEELNQLTEAGLGVNAILTEAFGISGAELADRMQRGLIPAKDAIEALTVSLERDFGGAAKAQANTISGLISSMSEIGELSSRNLFAGMFQSAQPYVADVVGVLTSPEFQTGVAALGTMLGEYTATGLDTAAQALESMTTSFQTISQTEAPQWLAVLGGLATAGGGTIDITGKVTKVNLDENLRVSFDAEAKVTTLDTRDVESGSGYRFSVDADGNITNVNWNAKDFQYTYDADAKVNSIQAPDGGWKVNFVADWKEGTIGALIDSAITAVNTGAKPVLDVAVKLPGDMTTSVATWWTNWKAGAEASLATWQPQTQVNAEWLPVALPGMQVELNQALADAVDISASWASDTLGGLWTSLQDTFDEPVMIAGSWLSSALGDLWQSAQSWFTSKPINLGVNFTTDKAGKAGTGFIDVNQSYPETYVDQVTGEVKRRARGGPAQGWAIVGEEGPELAYFGGGGAHIFSNPDSRKMFGVPGYADGTFGTPVGPAMVEFLRAIGMWQPQQRQIGPQLPDANDMAKPFQVAGNMAGEAFKQAAKDSSDALKSALRDVPGLFGTTQVTGDQMRLAEAGVPQNFADNYLRRLTDEVVNGVDWEGVDIKDAANRAGIDPNLPANIVLELFRSAWQDSSLFANPENLNLIDQTAVQEALQQQADQMAGQANIMALFGLSDKNLTGQIEGLGSAMQGVFGKAMTPELMAPVGQQAFGAIAGGFSDPSAAGSAVGNMAGAIVVATGTPENQAALADAGRSGFNAYWGGWTAAAGEATVPPPGGVTTPPVTGGKALGGRSSGWTVVGEFGPELVNLPNGSRVYDNFASQRMAGGGGGTTIVNQHFVVNDKLLAEQAAQRAVELIRRHR